MIYVIMNKESALTRRNTWNITSWRRWLRGHNSGSGLVPGGLVMSAVSSGKVTSRGEGPVPALQLNRTSLLPLSGTPQRSGQGHRRLPFSVILYVDFMRFISPV